MWLTRVPRRADHGAAAVEFALLFPIFVLIVFGIIGMGFGFNQKINLTQAAREASRYGATLSVKGSNATNTGTVGTWLDKVTEVAISAGGFDLAADRAGRYVCVALVQKDGTITSKVTGAGGPATNQLCYDDGARTDARVQVQVESQTAIDFIFFGSDLTLGSESVTHYEASPA